jgi:hypothetical protein
MKACRAILPLLLAFCFLIGVNTANGATLFLDSWGVSYGNWNPTPPASVLFSTFVEENFIATNTNSTSSTGINGLVGPGWGGEKFDAEAMYFGLGATDLYIAVVTGMPQGGSQDPWRSGSLYHYEPGDVRIQFNGSEFAISTRTVDTFVFPGTLLSGSLVWQDPRAYWSPTGFTDWGGVSNPYAVTAANNQSALGSNFSYTLLGTSTVNSTTINHYAIEAVISYASLGLGDFTEARSKSYDLHWTMECGNDAIDLLVPGQILPPVAEPTTLLLIGTGLAGLRLRRGRRGIFRS